MSVGLGGITAFVALQLWRLLRRRSVGVQSVQLALDGRTTTAGWVFAVMGATWLLFAAHSGFVQWHRAWGGWHLDRTEASRADAFSGALGVRSYSERHRRSAGRAARHFALADRWGLAGVVEVKLGNAWTRLLDDDLDGAVAAISEAIAIAPERETLHEELITLLVARNRWIEAEEALRVKARQIGAQPEDLQRVAALRAEVGDLAGAVDAYREYIDLAGESAQVRYNLGGSLRRLGRVEEAVTELARAAELAPEDYDTRVELGLALSSAGRDSEAIVEWRRAITLAPDRPESLYHLPRLIDEAQPQD
jgi:Flp pilus assembly protein TadD